MQNTEDRKWLYDRLKSEGYDIGTQEEFESSLNNEDDAKWYYEKASGIGLDVGTYDDFNAIFRSNPEADNQEPSTPIIPEQKERVKMTYHSPQFNPQPIARQKPQPKDNTPTKPKPDFGLNLGIPSIAETTKAMIEGRINPVSYTQPQEPEAITTFGEGVKQGTEQLYAGAEYGMGEALAPIVGTNRDDIDALAEIERIQAEGKDVAEETKNVTDLSTVSPIVKKGLELMGAGKAIGDAEKITQRNRTIQKALKESGGDVEKAKLWLGVQAAKKTKADELMADAQRRMAEAKPTKGWGWVGSMIPQMVGTGVGLVASAVFKSPLPAQVLGGVNMGVLTASTAGQAMAEARQAGASNSQVWGAGIVNGAIELLTEKIPFDRYTSKIVNAAKRQAGKTLADAASEVGSPANRELQDLLTRANKELDGRLFSGKNVREYLGDVVAEGLSEAAAEGLQTIVPIMYESPENYPTLLEIIGNAVEGAKGGLFMGTFLGGASKAAEHRANRARRKQQGFVDVAEVIDADNNSYVVEVVRDENDQEVFFWDGKKIPILDMEIKQRHAYNFDDFERARIELEQDEAYENGRTLETPQEKNDAVNMLEIQEANVRRYYGAMDDTDVDALLGENPMQTALDELAKDEEGGQTILDYLNAKASINGIIGAAQDHIEQAAIDAGAIIDSRKSNTDGLIHPAKMKLNDRQVYIISGNVAQLDDGTIDTQNSDESIIIMDAATGKQEFATAKDLLNIDEALDPEAEKATVRETIAETISTEVDNQMRGVLPFNVGDTYTIMGDDGTQHTAQVVAVDDENVVQVIMDNEAQPTTVTKDIIQQMSNAYNLNRAAQFEQGRQEQREAEKLQQEADQVVEPTNMVEQTPETPTEVIPERVVPTLKDGNPDFNAMEPDMFVEEYVSRYGEDSAVKIARKNISTARENVAKIDKKIDDITDPNQMEGLYAQRKSAEAQIARYSNILERLGASEDVNESEDDQRRRLRNDAGNRIATLFPDGMPNVESFILADIATGNRIRWSDKVTNGAITSRGLGAELGLSESAKERTRRLPLIGKDAMTPEEYAESLRERLDAAGIRYDETSLRDAVLSVYQSVDSRKGAWDALENMSKNMQEPQTDMDWEDMQQQMAYNKAMQTEDESQPQSAETELPDLETYEEEAPISEGENRKEVYNRQTTAKQPAEVVETSQSVESNGTQTPSSLIDVSTPKSSESKDTTTEPQKQEVDEKISQPERISIEEYLSQLGLRSPISDFMDDKMRNPHGLTAKQRKRLEQEAANAAESYHAKRNDAMRDYAKLVADGKIIPASDVDILVSNANGHPDNESTMAARRVLKKRGYDWETGVKISDSASLVEDEIRFRSTEQPTPIFYSNAEYAVKGVKVGEVTMPNLEENNTMHSIDVTDVMRESVMQGQPMFRSSNTNYESQFANLQSEYDALDKNDAEALNAWRDKKADVVRSYVNWVSDKFGLKCELYVFNGSREEEMRKVYDTMVEKYKANGIENIPSYESFKEKVTNPKVVATHRKRINFVTFNTSADDAELDIDQFAETLFHENAHRIAQGMYSKQEFEQIWENAKKSKNRIAKSVEKLYSGKNDAQKGNEFIAKAIGELVRNHKQLFTKFLMDKGDISADDLVKKLKYSLPLGKLALTETLNEFRNEYRERVLQGSGSSILGGSRDGGDFEVSEGDGGRNSRGNRKGESRRLRAERGRDVVKAATDLASSLGVKLNVIEDVNEITDPNNRMQRAKRDAKAWYDVKTDQVYFVAPNATSIADAQESVLHEVVAHKGLRDVVGRENFNRFLDKVFQSAAPEIRTQIVSLAAQNRWDFRVVTEEYLASLAEEGFDSRENRTFWQKVRDLFMDMLRETKIALGYNINDNDMRYMLWRTYQMQRSQGAMAVAEDIVMQQKMGVGDFRTRPMTEEEQIIADAKANGAYLKAPNGKKSNLTPKQWAQVRTKAFKKWFGDWEKAARIEKLRKSKDAKITGNEIEASEDLKQYRKNAQEYGKTLRGEYVNADTGNSIILNKDSLKEVLHHDGSNIAHIQSIAAIPQMIENGIYITSESVEENASKRMRNAKYVHYYVCGLKIGNTPYTVKFVIAEYANGDRYYDHSLTQIEKGDLLNRAELSSTVAESKSPISDIKDKRLISILQTNSSKVVDANGEPKVVYHRTSNEFTTFDTEKIGSSTDWGAFGMGFYFSPNSERYGLYGNNEMALFLNAQNPLMLDNSNAYDMKEPFFKDGSWDKEASEDFTKWVKDNGYDAVVYKTDLNEEVVVFEPNQIKSATDNIGTFDPSNDDIRFRSTEITEEERVNARFNEELNELTEDNARERILNVGMPSPILRASGIENKPIRLYGAKLLSKVRKHGYKLSDLQNLPSALNNPIAVFKGSHDGSFAILTELAIGNNNVLATLSIGKGGHDVDFNIISSVYDKKSENVLRWINDGKLLYVDKEKALNYFSVSAPVAEAQSNQGLSSVTKIIENFVNPTIEDTKNELNSDILFRSDKPEPPAQGVARDMYDHAVRKRMEGKNNVGRFENLWHHIAESYQDSMLAVNDLYKAILAETGKKLHSFEDVYKAENRLSSTNKAQIEAWERDFMKPLQNVIMSLIDNGTTYNDIIEYILAKSGIERNRVLAERDAEEATNRWEEKRLKGAERAFRYEKKRINGTYGGNLAALHKSLDTGAISQQEYDTKAAELEVQRNNKLGEVLKKYERLKKKIQADRSEMYLKAWEKNRDKDYSGLTELTGEKQDFNIAAQDIVDTFEGKHETAPLWDAINAATKETLRKSYDSGMMNKETFDKVSTMFKYYVPLRGWDNNVAADHYEYMSDKGMRILPALKTAKGRTSRADDPIATIGSMGESSIIQGNRNIMKQQLLNFAQNNPTSLLTVGEQWYVKMPDGTWVEHNPVIPENATGDEVDAIIKQHEADMKALGEDATKSRNKLNLGMHATSWEGQEHVINVKRNGKVYQIFVNGNPIAAQAINGFTNPNAKESWLSKAASAIKNFMARVFTSQNPAFIVNNLRRDVIWAGTSVAIKENPAYAKQYAKNIMSAFGNATLPRLVYKWKKGTLDMSNTTERYFHEFITNGGETGFTQLNTVDDYKRNMQRFIKEAQGGATTVAKKAWRGFWEGVEFLNRSAEDTTRFMVYITSRQMGRSISESISNAKDVTVNFNKKGRGEYGASMMNYLYIFFNATVQSLANFGKLIKNHPAKAMAAISTYTAAGFILPLAINALQTMFGDDDEEKNPYWDLPEWVRRNNIVLGAGGVYVTIPLPHELRPFYGLGEIAYSVLSGKEPVEYGLKKASEGFAALLPFDFTGNGSNAVINFTPTIAQPLVQVHYNTDYFGTPIYRKTAFNEKDPEWTKVYKSTNAMAVDAAEFINYITGGDIVKKGAIDINPAVVEHIVEAYLGGLGKTLNRTAKSLSMIWDEDMREVRNVPILNSFIQVSDERSTGSQLNREYFNALDEFENTEHLLQGYKKQKKMGAMEYAEKLDDLMKSPIYKRYEIIKGRKKAISELNKQLQMADPADREDVETKIMNLKVSMLDALNAVDDNPMNTDTSNK